MNISRPCESCKAETKHIIEHYGFRICSLCKAESDNIERARNDAAKLLAKKGKK